MTYKVILLFVIGFVSSTSANVLVTALGNGVTTTGDAALNTIIAKSSGYLEKILESADLAFNLLKQNTVSTSNSLRDQYVKKFETIRNHLDQAREQYITSYTNNQNAFKNILQTNFQNTENEIKPTFALALESFKKSFTQLAQRIPGLGTQLEAKAEELTEKARLLFENAEVTRKALNDQLDKDLEDGIAQLSQ